MTAVDPTSQPATLATGAPRGGGSIDRYFLVHLLGAMFPLAAGAMLYGWRAIGLVGLLAVCTMAAIVLWRRVGTRGCCLRLSHGLWLAVLLGMMLPPHLMSNYEPGRLAPYAMVWAIVPAAGFLLTMLMWLSGGAGFTRLHPALVAYLLLAGMFSSTSLLQPRFVLHRHRIFNGDIAQYTTINDPRIHRDEAWVYWGRPAPADAVRIDTTAAESLSAYMRGKSPENHAWFSIDSLLHDAMPPMEDLVVGGHPGAVGLSSAIAVLVGGLFLMYRGLIHYRIPAVMVLTVYLWVLVLPIPVTIADGVVRWKSLTMTLRSSQLDWATFTMLTFANYQILASPLLFVAMFLASSPMLAPLGRRAQINYAILLGSATAAAQLYISCSVGPYIALLAVSQLTPWLERHLARPAKRDE